MMTHAVIIDIKIKMTYFPASMSRGVPFPFRSVRIKQKFLNTMRQNCFTHTTNPLSPPVHTISVPYLLAALQPALGSCSHQLSTLFHKKLRSARENPKHLKQLFLEVQMHVETIVERDPKKSRAFRFINLCDASQSR